MQHCFSCGKAKKISEIKGAFVFVFSLRTKHETISFCRCTCSEASTGKDVCDRSIAIIFFLRKWIKISREYSTAQNFAQGLAEMRLKRSYASDCVVHDANVKPLVVRETKDSKLIGRMSDIGFYYSTLGEPLGLRLRDKCGIGTCEVILANHLVLPFNSHQIPTEIIITSSCKIGEEVFNYFKPKK